MKKLLVALLVVAAAIGGGVFYESKLEARDAATYAAPGKLVVVDGRKLQVWCVGAGAPTVVFESAELASSVEWEALLPRVGQTHRACAYDRAGMGWSDPVDGARTAASFVDDARAALTAAGEKPPYVLVGHGAGGALVRAWAGAHRDEVHGLVLVDTTTAWMTTRWPQLFAKIRSHLSRGRFLAAVGLLRLGNPLHLGARDAALTYRARSLGAAEQLLGAAMAALPSLPVPPEVPAVVLTHGRGGDWAGPGVVNPVDEAAIEQDWQVAQKELGKGPKASLVVAESSGHEIPVAQPDVVLQAIDKLAAPPPPAPPPPAATPTAAPAAATVATPAATPAPPAHVAADKPAKKKKHHR